VFLLSSILKNNFVIKREKMMKYAWSKLSIVLVLFLTYLPISYACTDFRLIAQDGSVIISRSMEFALDLQSRFMTSTRAKSFAYQTPNGKAGLSWKAKYGYVFLDFLNTGMAVDGMNEAGLSIETLYLPGFTQYQSVPVGQEAHALPYFAFADWVLGNFQTVDEVKLALSNVYVYAEVLSKTNSFVFPVHFSIYDSSGKGIVIEFIEGKLQAHDSIGVLTNAPSYEWHVNNLRNYLNLTPTNPKPVIADGMTFVATGQGAGMVGLPGDVSPPSRFVKTALLLKTVLTPVNAEQAVNIGQHIINNVDIPAGLVREIQNVNTATMETTQWAVFKDLSHKMFYYRTYGDLTLRAINLSKIDFSEHARQLIMPLSNQANVVDMTKQFQQ
jgi:choloylglycine hydrolase